MKMKNKFKLTLLFFLFSLIAGCANPDAPADTPTTGEITISVDETFKPFIESEIHTFQSIYKYADINVNYKPEVDAFSDLMSDSLRLIIVSRTLNKNELKEFKKWEIVPKITKIAYDAVALIGYKERKDSVITLAELKNLLSGADPSSSNTKIVFDNNNSSTINFLMNKTGFKKLSTNCYAVKSNKAVLDYVAGDKNSIGVIGVNWISDKDDTTNMNFLKSVRVLEVAVSDTSESYKPYQAYIAQKTYPLVREVFVLSKEAYTGLGTGLTAFLASERGQRIILKQGLVPATMPVRIVEFKENDEL